MTVQALGHLDEHVTASATVDGADLRVEIGDGGSLVADARLRFIPELPAPLSTMEAELIALSVALVAGQASLAPLVTVDSLTANAESTAARLLGLLYDSHAYAQRMKNWPRPVLEVRNRGADAPPYHRDAPRRRAVLLWSGGKDALAALDVLRVNDFEVVGLHATANDAVQDLEQEAANRLARENDLELIELDLEWPIISEMLKAWSRSSSQYPLRNPIPHGRDLVLTAAAAAVGRTIGATYITAGYEYELWSKIVRYEGREVARHDVQSRKASELVDRLLACTTGMHFFSPLAAFREREIMSYLLSYHSSAWDHIVSCFWDRWCGECTKCLRYCLSQEALGVRRVKFAVDPLQDGSLALDQLLGSIGDESLPFWEQQIVNLYALYERGVFAENSRAASVLRERAAWYSEQRELLETKLVTRYPDDLAPAGFRWELGSGREPGKMSPDDRGGSR